MENGTLIKTENTAVSAEQVDALREMMQRMSEAMGAMAAMMQATNERMTAMERKISALEKVTPGQAAEINRMMVSRAEEVTAAYRIAGAEQKIVTLIRRAVRLETGVKSAREISRCDFGIVRDMIETWDDFEEIRKIRKSMRG